MGSQSKVELAYIAGFLDGDGSLMFQVKRRSDGNRGWRFMCTICFYQDRRHHAPLLWIRDVFGVGYMSHRNDGITELRINGFKQIRNIIEMLYPYLRFKQSQAQIMLFATDLLSRKKYTDLTNYELMQLVDSILAIQDANYASRSKKTKDQLLLILGLTP